MGEDRSGRRYFRGILAESGKGVTRRYGLWNRKCRSGSDGDSKYLTNEQVGTPSGLATLDANGKLTASQRPDVDAYTRKQTDDLVDQDVAAHNTDETAHGDIRASIAAVDAAVKAIELKYGTEITKNPFSVGSPT